ncbi:inter-alpha-trypsin inhibitor heavy chain H4-like isoform X2 [Ylistrum balloti]|uniref:inter-alpha-trypsin inhibitor heavy chain H4-like isoform X2 n=1 Tax=Ylistrum balloti TaxID=509963 RepID=UPI002905A896|nr:inter-alpha-trypsin inhibitor heavy chain H4-like isoform X2 [Ylistrum balloti]
MHIEWFTPVNLVMAVMGALLSEQVLVSGQQPNDLTMAPKVYYLHIKSDIRYRFATTVVTSKIANPDLQAHQTTFKVTLPNEAFITNFTLTVGNHTWVGDVKRKEEARQEYESAVSQGRSAAHISVRPRETNMFNIDVNVAAEQKVTFELRYQELLQRKLGSYNHVIYVKPGQPVDDMRIDVDIFESRAITSLNVPPIRNDILTNIDVTAVNTHAVVDRISDRRVHIRYAPSVKEQISEGDSEGLDGQFRVTYDVERQKDGGDLLMVNGYFVHFFAPKGLEPRPKDIVFVLDKSGSMAGLKIKQLKQAMETILSQIDPADTFNIVTFDSGRNRWKAENLVPASEANIQAAVQFTSDIRANGGTNIQDAMLYGLSLLEERSDRSRSALIIFLTDGQPTSGETNPSTILERVLRRNEDRVPVFSLAFGRNADYNLVKKLAAQNKGFGRRIYEDSDANLQISNFYSEVSSVLLKNVTFSYLEGTVEEETLICDLTNVLHRGSELVVSGRMVNEQSNDLQPHVTGIGANGMISLHVPDTALTTQLNITQDNDAIAITEKLWAYLTVKQWIKQMEASTVENDQESWKENITEMALKYNFVTPLTSMVVTLPDELQVSPIKVEEDDMDSRHQLRPFSQFFTSSSNIKRMPVNHPILPVLAYDAPTLAFLPRSKLIPSSTLRLSTRTTKIPTLTTPAVKFSTRSPGRRKLRIRTKAADYTLVAVKGVSLPLCFRNPGYDSVDATSLYNLTKDYTTGMSVRVGYTFHGAGKRRRSRINRIIFITKNATTKIIPGFSVENGVRKQAPVYSVYGQDGPNLKWEVINKNNRLSLLADFTRNNQRNIEGSLVIPIQGTIRFKRNKWKGKLFLQVKARTGIKVKKSRVKFSKSMECWVTKKKVMLNI